MENPYSGLDPKNQLRPAISREKFFGTSGFEFGWNILAPINIAKSPAQEPDLAKRFSDGQKALYFWWFLDAQVTNGGFIQFYFNRYGKYIPAILAGMNAIGDSDMEDLVRRAHHLFLANQNIIAKRRRQHNLGDLYEDLAELGALDSEYYLLHHQTMAKIEELAKRAPWDFCSDESGNGYDPDYTGEIRTDYPGGQIKDISTVKNGVIDGEFICYFESGQKKSLHTYEAGIMTGLQQTWGENGITRKILRINREEEEIIQESFNLEGQLKKRAHLDLAGENLGPFWEFYESGARKNQGIYADRYNMRGEFLQWWENGQLKCRSEYTGKGKTIHDYWTESGEQLLSNGTGIFVSERTNSTGTIRRETSFVEYRLEGPTKVFVDGLLEEETHYKDGVQHGPYREYDKQGNITLEELYAQGKKVEG